MSTLRFSPSDVSWQAPTPGPSPASRGGENGRELAAGSAERAGGARQSAKAGFVPSLQRIHSPGAGLARRSEARPPARGDTPKGRIGSEIA